MPLYKIKRIWTQALKELAQFRRDKLTVALAFVLPLLTFLIFGYAIRLEQKDIPISLQDFDNSPLSRAYAERLFATEQLRGVSYKGGDVVKATLDRGLTQAAVIIPPEFSRKFKAGLDSPIEVLIDGTDVNNARVIKNSIVASTQFFQQTLAPPARGPQIKADIRLWFNPGRKESLYVIPGVIALVLWIYPSMLSALAMVREKEQGTILQAYASSITAIELILGKALAYVFIGICEGIMLIILGFILFGLTFASDPTPFILSSLLYVFDSVLFGLTVGTGVKTQNAAVQAVATGGFTTAFLLSGFMYPLRNIKFPFNYVSIIVPARYFVSISRDAFVRGSGWVGTWYMPLALLAFAVVYLRICHKRLHKMQLE